MTNSLQARFISLNTIEVTIDTNIIKNLNGVTFYCNNDVLVTSESFHRNTRNNLATYGLNIQSFLFGGEYYLIINNEKYYIDVTPIMQETIIDDKFVYEGHDLGFTYSKKETTFKLWSPLASQATVKIFNKRRHEKELVMERGEHGVFSATLKGNLDGYSYLFSTTINGVKHFATDPYAVASLPNGEESVIIDFNKTTKQTDPKLPPMKQYTDAIIYEASVRDMTSYEYTDVVNKGTFLGLVEEGKRSTEGALVGIDHLVKMGITHLQLLPVEDFLTVDELNPKAKYNWGYDPMQYNVPEGSYCTDVLDPYSRINEFKYMIEKLHKKGIRVNMDVVYNHMYDCAKSAFEILTPNYYFRRDKHGSLSNGSFCGNELASERKMCSRFIIDSCKHWVKNYQVDGFRFDLMGLTDIDTMNTLVKECSEIRKDLMFYGEGWDMPSCYPSSKRATIFNSDKTPFLAHFNDVYRDIVKGKSMDGLATRGFMTGEESFLEGFKYVLMGCTSDFCFPHKFLSANCSVNYVECHDNETLFDKIDVTNKQESSRQKLKRVSLINQVVLLSFGIPFIHMGQEIGLSKFGETNTYNSGDRFNQFDYSKMEDRKWMVKSINDCIKLRKQYDFLRLSSPEEIAKSIYFENIDNSGVIMKFINKDLIKPFSEFKIIINPSNKTTYYDLGDYYQVLYNEAGIMKEELYSQSLMINPLTLVIVVKKA